MEPTKTLQQVINESFNFEEMSQEQQQQASTDLQNIILENTILRIFDENKQETHQKYELFQKQLALYGNSPESMIAFLEKEIPEFYTILFTELEIVKNS
jgi:hypothetical protein